jgi:uncharacterized protein YggE
VAVSGSASVTAPPDRARVAMGVQARGTDMTGARSQVAAVSNRFLRFCEQLGIPANKVQTTGLTLRPEYRWNEEMREQQFAGYLVQRQLEVELDDLELLGRLIEGAVDAGVNQVSPPVLDSTRRDTLEREALAAAAAEARANAQVLAKSLDARLGPVQQINASDMGGPPVPMMRTMAMEADDGGAGSYRAGDLRFEARVDVVFELLPR